MSRKIVRLTLDHLDALPAPCRSCLFWELDPVRRARVEDRAGEKDAWLSHVLLEWGSCGRVALVDDVAVGYLIYAPPAYLPGAEGFPTAPVSPDAVLLSTMYVDSTQAGGGLGRMLVQAMARDLIERGGIRAVEAFGDTRGAAKDAQKGGERGGCQAGRQGGGRCVVPVEFLGSVGFKTHRAHSTTPRMRMELRSALTWKDEVEAALERLMGVVRPAPKRSRAASPKATRASRGSQR